MLLGSIHHARNFSAVIHKKDLKMLCLHPFIKQKNGDPVVSVVTLQNSTNQQYIIEREGQNLSKSQFPCCLFFKFQFY